VVSVRTREGGGGSGKIDKFLLFTCRKLSGIRPDPTLTPVKREEEEEKHICGCKHKNQLNIHLVVHNKR
jgi:hypothetical protein